MIIIERKKQMNERYKVIDIAKAVGASEGAISAYFSNRGRTTKNGLTLDDIVEFTERTNTRGGSRGVDWNKVAEIRKRLCDERGIIVKEVEDDTMKLTEM